MKKQTISTRADAVAGALLLRWRAYAGAERGVDPLRPRTRPMEGEGLESSVNNRTDIAEALSTCHSTLAGSFVT